MTFLDHPLCGPRSTMPSAYWGPESFDPSAWRLFAPRLDTVEEIALLLEALDGAERILDVGGGTGLLTRSIAALFGRCTVVEPSQDQRAELSPTPGSFIEVVPGRAEALPFESESFDAVIATWVLQYTDDPEGAVCEIARVARRTPGSRVVLVQAAPGNDIVDIWNAEAAVAGTGSAHHGFLLARAADWLAAQGFEISLRRFAVPLRLTPAEVGDFAHVLQRLHWTGHPRSREIREAAEMAITRALDTRGDGLADDGVLLVARRT